MFLGKLNEKIKSYALKYLTLELKLVIAPPEHVYERARRVCSGGHRGVPVVQRRGKQCQHPALADGPCSR